MAIVDATMAEYFKQYVVPLVAILIVLRILALIWQKIFPYVYAGFCKRASKFHHKHIKDIKDKLFSDMASIREDSNKRFNALEIGCGPGSNFGVYPQNTSLIVVEPKEQFKKPVAESAAQHPSLEIREFLAMGAEDLKEHVPSNSQDAVVCTLTLCSCQDSAAVVREAHRVLKPGGRFYYIEHTAAHDKKSWTYFFQRICSPFFKSLAQCSIKQTPWTAIDRTGFSKVQYTKMNVTKVPMVFRPHLVGFAAK